MRSKGKRVILRWYFLCLLTVMFVSPAVPAFASEIQTEEQTVQTEQTAQTEQTEQ